MTAPKKGGRRHLLKVDGCDGGVPIAPVFFVVSLESATLPSAIARGDLRPAATWAPLTSSSWLRVSDIHSSSFAALPSQTFASLGRFPDLDGDHP